MASSPEVVDLRSPPQPPDAAAPGEDTDTDESDEEALDEAAAEALATAEAKLPGTPEGAVVVRWLTAARLKASGASEVAGPSAEGVREADDKKTKKKKGKPPPEPTATEVAARKFAEEFVGIEIALRAPLASASTGDEPQPRGAQRARQADLLDRLRRLAENAVEEEAAAAVEPPLPWYKRPMGELAGLAWKGAKGMPASIRASCTAAGHWREQYVDRKKRAYYAFVEYQLRRHWSYSIEIELWRIAYDAGRVTQPPPPVLCPRRMRDICSFPCNVMKTVKVSLGCDQNSKVALENTLLASFSEDEVVMAYRRARPRQMAIVRVMRGNARRVWTGLSWLVAAVFAAAAFYALALIVFSTSADYTFSSAGAMIASSSVQESLSTSPAIQLRTISEYPLADLDELSSMRDVIFAHNMGMHVLQVAGIARQPSGAVDVQRADGSSLRVDPGGRIFWRRERFSELRLRETELWGSNKSVYASKDLLASSVGIKQVVV